MEEIKNRLSLFIINNFDYVALLNGDGQYAPEILSDLLSSFDAKDTKAVFGQGC